MSEHALDAPARVLLPVEAKARGFCNALAFRRWCRRRNVPVLRDGKLLWVKRTDVDRALDTLAGSGYDDGCSNERTAVADTVAAITRGVR
jgi:hypothetical protein